MSKRNSKSSNVSCVVVVRCTALQWAHFLRLAVSFATSGRSCLYVEQKQSRCFKRNRENTGTMRESTGTGHTEGDHVLVTAILSAIFIVVLVYLLVIGQPFSFRRLERAGTPPRQQQTPAGSIVRLKQHFCPVFSTPSATTQEATTLSQIAQRR